MLIRLDERFDQLIPRFDRIDAAIRGDGTEANPGILSLFRLHRQEFGIHLEDHARVTRRLSLLATGLGSLSGLIVWLAGKLRLI